MNKNVRLITVSAVTLALTVVMGAFPFVFLVPLLFTTVTRGWKMTIIAALSFGVVSYLYAYMGTSIVAVAFLENPWIPIVPRIFVGLAAHGAYVLTRKLVTKGNKAKILPVSVAISVGCIANTGLVVTCLMLFASSVTFGELTMPLYLTTMLISGLIELVICNVVIPPLALTVGKALKLPDYNKGVMKIKKEESR